jgi:hypothetical protein
MAAGGLSYFCLDTKVTKRSSQQKGFFAALGLCLAKRATWAGIILPLSRRPMHAKTSYALQPHNPSSFCPFSAEAVLLTFLENKSF